MRKMIVAGAVLVSALSASAWAQTATKPTQQKPAQTFAGPRFVDANGDGVCDNFAAGEGLGRGMGGGFGRGMGGGFGRGMRGGLGGNFAFGQNGASLIDVAARLTGQAPSAVAEALRNGQSFAQISAASGKSAQDLVEAAMAERKTVVGQAVSQGRLTPQQADQVMALMRTRIESNLEGTWQPRGGGLGGLCPLNRWGAAPPAAR